jgi:hypothetical protein
MSSCFTQGHELPNRKGPFATVCKRGDASKHFERQRDALAAADAQRDITPPEAVAPHRMVSFR